MLKRLARAYLRRRHGLTEPWQRIKPPLGWPWWYRPPLGRRLRYALARARWLAEEALRGWAYQCAPVVSPWAGAAHVRPNPGLAELDRDLLQAELRRASAGSWLVVPAGLALTPSALVLTPSAPDYDGAVKPVSELSYGSELTDGAGI